MHLSDYFSQRGLTAEQLYFSCCARVEDYGQPTFTFSVEATFSCGPSLEACLCPSHVSSYGLQSIFRQTVTFSCCSCFSCPRCNCTVVVLMRNTVLWCCRATNFASSAPELHGRLNRYACLFVSSFSGSCDPCVRGVQNGS